MSARTVQACKTWRDRKVRAQRMIKDFCRNWPVEGLTYKKATTLNRAGYDVEIDGYVVMFSIENGKTRYCGEYQKQQVSDAR